MVLRRLAGEAIYAGVAGFVLAIVATAFTVVAVGLPVVVGFEGVLVATAASICFGGAVASVSLFGRIDRERRLESLRAP